MIYDIYMVIYVEYVVIDNLIIDTLMLCLTNYFLKLRAKKTNIFLSSLIGTTVALISPNLSSIINLLLKLPLSCIMVLTCFKSKKFKQFVLQLITFYICTFLMVGACLVLCELFGIKYIVNNGFAYEYKFPIGFALGVCFLTFVCAKNVISQIFLKHKLDKFIISTKIIDSGKEFKVTAFLDTGNKLIKDGKEISIIGYKTFYKLYPNISITDILLHRNLPLKNFDYIEVKSIGKAQKILVFEIEKIIIEKKVIEKPLLGLSFENFEKNTNSDLIISNKILGDEYELCKN